MAKNVTGMCNLCFLDKKLVRGHIMPDWASRLSIEKLEATLIESPNWRKLHDPSLEKPHGLIAEHLFCEECDNKMGLGEEMLRQIVHPTNKKPSNISKPKDFSITITGENQIKNFATGMGGLILKAHVAKEVRWKLSKLTNKQYKIILSGMRDNTLHENIEISVFKMYTLDNFRVNNLSYSIKDFQSNPFDVQASFTIGTMDHGTFKVVFLFGGLLIAIDVNSKKNDSLASQNIMKIPLGPLDLRYLITADSVLGIDEFNKVFVSHERLRFFRAFQNTPLSSRCPCRVHYTKSDMTKGPKKFGECCYIYWGIENR